MEELPVEPNRPNISQASMMAYTARLRAFKSTPPSSGQKNSKWLQDFDTVHTRLQLYWEHIFDIYDAAYRKLALSEDNRHVLMQALHHWKKAEYRERLKAKHASVLGSINAAKQEDVFIPLPLSDETNQTLKIGLFKSKKKTKGAVQGAESVQAELAAPTKQRIEPAKTIQLSERSLATLRPLFPVTPRERSNRIDWDAFVDSMINVGFSVKSKGGSEVTFEHPQGGRIASG
ncbi:hypothetical protein E8E11_002337 [Didymella keratinophila]|nr:hypothetical protein E8E11_002337 [Didymella keratinophila]